MYDENFGSLSPYKEYSMEIEKYNHPYWAKEDLQREVCLLYANINVFRVSFITFSVGIFVQYSKMLFFLPFFPVGFEEIRKSSYTVSKTNSANRKIVEAERPLGILRLSVLFQLYTEERSSEMFTKCYEK